MKLIRALFTCLLFTAVPFCIMAQANSVNATADNAAVKNLYIDVHQLKPGKVKFEEAVKAHAKDLIAEKKNGVHFIKYWVNEEKGLLYCLASATDTQSIRKTHSEAHGLLPEQIYQVTEGTAAMPKGKNGFFLDVHYFGAGKVTAKDVAEAHEKDLAAQSRYGANFMNYWVDEKNGTVMCLVQAADSNAVIKTHAAAHGFLPAAVNKVKQGE
jgi:Protein of unknown function (DUF4242)